MPAKEIVQHIFKHPSLENISVEELQNVARQYPYFSIVQLLLAKKKYELQPEEYLQQLGIANLYAGNPFVLHQYFYSKPVEELPATNEEQNTTAELSPEEENYRRKETEEIINEISIPENVTGEISGEEIITSPDETMQEENVEEEIVQEIEVKDEAVVEEIVQNEEIIQNEEPIQNDEIKQADEIIAEEIVQDEVKEVIPEKEIVQDENAPQADMPEAALPEEIISSSPEENIPDAENEEEIISAGTGNENKEIPPPIPVSEKEDWLIRPLYTEDYFAYQGIKLPDVIDSSKKPTEAQLRSFTDWLRATRRPKGSADPDNPDAVHTSSLQSIYVSQEDGEITPEVEKMAIDSITAQENITTESMAEVRRHQGQREKAIAIYEKLSLLNPEKSDYFAQKIAELKLK